MYSGMWKSGVRDMSGMSDMGDMSDMSGVSGMSGVSDMNGMSGMSEHIKQDSLFIGVCAHFNGMIGYQVQVQCTPINKLNHLVVAIMYDYITVLYEAYLGGRSRVPVIRL